MCLLTAQGQESEQQIPVYLYTSGVLVVVSSNWSKGATQLTPHSQCSVWMCAVLFFDLDEES